MSRVLISTKAQVVDGGAATTEPKQLGASSEGDKQLRGAVDQALEVLNRGGSLDERMLEARCLLAGGVRQIASVQ